MADTLKANTWRIGIAVAVVAVLAGGLYVSRFRTSEAFPAMPSDEQDYWSWVTTINRGSKAALEAGISLLKEHPHIPRLYLRLADLCLEDERTSDCLAAFDEVQPPTPQSVLYRDAARTRLIDAAGTQDARPLWQYLAQSADLDPGIARLIVDVARSDSDRDWSDTLEAAWEAARVRNPKLAGAAFGLGYLGVLRGDWDRGETLLTEATRLRPDDPEAYRELGRIYYTTGRPDEFESALTAGIQAAKTRHELEKELILRGNLGLGVRQRGDLERAEAIFEAALEQSRALRDGETEGFNLYRLAALRVQQHRYYEALALLQDAAVLYHEHVSWRRPEVMAQQGVVLRNLFRFADAEALLEATIAEARALSNQEAELHAYIALASLQYQMGRYQAGLSTARTLLFLADRAGHVDSEISARMILGDLYSIDGEFDTARTEYEAALSLAREAKNGLRIRELYDRLGNAAISVHDANAAQAYFADLLDEVKKTQQSTAIADAYIGLGRSYQEFRNFVEAVRYYNLALHYVDIESEPRQAFDVYIGKAWAYIYLDDLDRAAVALDSASTTAIVPHDVYRLEVAWSNLALEQNDFKTALSRVSRAETIIDNERWPLNWHWHVFHAKALAQWHLGQHRPAEDSFRKAVRAIEALRENLSSSEDRAVFVHTKTAVYKNFSAFLEEQGRYGEAFHLAERARSRSLVDLLYTTQRERKQSALQEFQAIETARQLRALAEEERQLTSLLASSSSELLETQLRNVRRESRRADSVRAALDYSDISKLYTFDPINASQAQRLVQSGEAMLMFSLREVWRSGVAHDASVAYVVLEDTIRAIPIAVNRDQLTEAVRFLRLQIGPSDSGPSAGWEPTARRLYNDLMRPIISSLPATVKHLHVVPEGILHYLPFAALLDEQDRFLIERYSLSVTPSVSILQLCRDKNPRQWRSMLLLADPDGRLPGSRTEVLDIARVSPNRRLAFVGSAATQSLLEENASYYDVLHLATHGTFNSRAPWQSHLDLAGDVLSVAEIGGLDLDDTYLVTLSACETALSGGAISDIPDGDEWVGLNQAFLAAGAPTVMASLWPIDDRVSGRFMVSFYEELGRRGKAGALAYVQRQFVTSKETRHPFYWAAFTVIGDPN